MKTALTIRPRRLSLTTRKEPCEEQAKAGRYNPATQVRFKRRWFTLACGTSDEVYFWSFGYELHVLTLNASLGYVGLEVFDSRDGCLGADFYCQNACEEMREDIFDLSAATVRAIAEQFCR